MEEAFLFNKINKFVNCCDHLIYAAGLYDKNYIHLTTRWQWCLSEQLSNVFHTLIK